MLIMATVIHLGKSGIAAKVRFLFLWPYQKISSYLVSICAIRYHICRFAASIMQNQLILQATVKVISYR